MMKSFGYAIMQRTFDRNTGEESYNLASITHHKNKKEALGFIKAHRKDSNAVYVLVELLEASEK